jgi:hypothetical protein
LDADNWDTVTVIGLWQTEIITEPKPKKILHEYVETEWVNSRPYTRSNWYESESVPDTSTTKVLAKTGRTVEVDDDRD